nr:hypothetical protein PsAHV6-046 [Psittacid alphaherpesvirus 6]
MVIATTNDVSFLSSCFVSNLGLGNIRFVCVSHNTFDHICNKRGCRIRCLHIVPYYEYYTFKNASH